jgi:hypothetical protein
MAVGNPTPDLGVKWEICMAGRVAGSFRPPSAAGHVVLTVVASLLGAPRWPGPCSVLRCEAKKLATTDL